MPEIEPLKVLCSYCTRLIEADNAVRIGGRNYCTIKHYEAFTKRAMKRMTEHNRVVLRTRKTLP